MASRNPSVRIAEHAFFSSASLSILRTSFLVVLFVRQLQNRSATPRFPALPRAAVRAHRCPRWHELSEVVKAFIFASRRKVILPRQTRSEREPCQTAESQGEGRPTDRPDMDRESRRGLPPMRSFAPSSFPSFTGDITICFLTSSAPPSAAADDL